MADTDSGLDAVLGKLTTSLNTLRSQSSAFGANLSIVQNRQDFTKSMMNTLQGGADNLTLADQNEEGANLLASTPVPSSPPPPCPSPRRAISRSSSSSGKSTPRRRLGRAAFGPPFSFAGG